MSSRAVEKSALMTRRPWATGSVLLLAFLLWLLNHPYQGIWHDARVYGLIAAHWIYPEALASDLFFRFGSQGSLSLFTPIYGALVRVLGTTERRGFQPVSVDGEAPGCVDASNASTPETCGAAMEVPQ